jgi:hypothetical protein
MVLPVDKQLEVFYEPIDHLRGLPLPLGTFSLDAHATLP